MDSVTPATTPAADPAASSAVLHEITLEQFAVELSMRDKRVSLVNAFVFVEKRARHFKDTEPAFQARFTKFVTTPV